MTSKKVAHLIILPMICLSSVNQINAQNGKKIELKQAIQLALDSNLALHSARYSVEADKALKASSWDLPKAVVNGEYGQINSYAYDNSFTISQTIAFPSVYIHQNQFAKANVQSSEWKLKSSQVETATQIKQVYWQLVYLISKQKLKVYQDSLYSGFLRAARLRANTGETNRLEMITAQSRSLEVKNQLRQVVADIEIHAQKLQTILNSEVLYLPADTVLNRNTFVPVPDTSLLTLNPSVAYIKQQTELARLEKKVERSKMYPDISVGYFSQTMQGLQEVNGVPTAFGKSHRFSSVQAGITIPLWFIPYTSRSKEASIQEQAARTNAEYYSKTLIGNYRVLTGEYTKYSNSIEYYEKQAIPEADLIIEQAARSYQAGAMDYLDYIINLNHALSIKESYLDALNNFNQTVISIESMTGKIF